MVEVCAAVLLKLPVDVVVCSNDDGARNVNEKVNGKVVGDMLE